MHKTNELGRGLSWAILVALLVGLAGCTRGFYRESADREVHDILREKDTDERWRIEQYHVNADPRSRFHDPSNPDRPPMPPDDEGAWKNSPHPQKPGHKGPSNVAGTAYLEMLRAWDAENRAELQALEGAQKSDPAQDRAKRPILTYYNEPLRSGKAGFLLKMDQAIELGVINSPIYQTFREQLYLAALPVTQQRYSYAYQWAATADWIREWAGPKAQGGQQNNWTGSSTIGFTKLFSTGALLTADFANTTVFNFVGNGFTSGSTINGSLTQPLLQGGGKAVTLEPLTQAERNLLYSIRAYARFREQFNVSVALGTTAPADLRSAAGTTNSASPISVLAALGIASTDVSGGFVGYLSTLYRECDMAADKKWVNDLQRALRILEAYQEGGMFSPLQVDQVRSQLLQAQNTVLADAQSVNNALDQFKVLLGLPANLPLILDDMPARPITRQLDRYYAVIDDAEKAQKFLEVQDKLAPEKLRPALVQTFTKSSLTLDTEFAKKMPGAWNAWVKMKDEDLKASLIKLGDDRRRLFNRRTELDVKGQTLSPQEADELLKVEFNIDVGGLEQQLRRYEARPWAKLADKEQAKKEQVKQFRLVVLAAKAVLVTARNDRFEGVSKIWPVAAGVMLGDFDLLTGDVEQAQELAVRAALESRLDLMNARAQVVDAWRQLRVTANALLGVATAQYSVQAQTTPSGVRPLAFAPEGVNQQINLNFQLPLNRVAQRNAYRTAQINYQVARRSLMVLEDNIASQVRFDVRQLQLFAANYSIQKKVLHSLYSQVESALEVIVAPADPDQLKSSGTTGAANSAALTNQYLGALNQLNNAQVKMYDLWLSIYATRMQLNLDLERLPLDLRGVWTDELLAPRSGTGAVALPAAVMPAPDDAAVAVPSPTGRPRPVARPVFLPPRAIAN